MFEQDQIVVVDFETVEIQPDGTKQASTEFYRDNFRVDSVAVSWRDGSEIKSKFVIGEDASRTLLMSCSKARLVAHNLSFELGVSRCRFPDIDLNWYADTQRLAQVYDNGGDENSYEMIMIDPETPDDEPDAKKMPLSGFGLVKCAKRILDLPDHKLEAYEWLRKNGVKKGREGAHLHMLPPDIYERYNVGDTETTLKLYEFIEEKFLMIDYNWRFDHELYLSTVRHIVSNKIRGVYVDREALAAYAKKVRDEIVDISDAFKKRFAKEIQQVERHNLIRRLRKYKKLKGKKAYLKKIPLRTPDYQKNVVFNSGSNKQLETLFVTVLGIEPKFFTAKGSPSFKSSMIGQFGEGGLMLQARRKRGIVLAQAESLLELTAVTGRWHCDLKAVGTSTGRFAGGS